MGKLSQEHIWKISQALMGTKNARKKAVMAEAAKHAPTAESATAPTSTDAPPLTQPNETTGMYERILIEPEGFFFSPEGTWCYECGSRVHSHMKEQHRKRCMLTQRTAWALERQRELFPDS